MGMNGNRRQEWLRLYRVRIRTFFIKCIFNSGNGTVRVGVGVGVGVGVRVGCFAVTGGHKGMLRVRGGMSQPQSLG